MIINYNPQKRELELGRPYTYGTGLDWFMRVGPSDVMFLGSESDSPKLLKRIDIESHIRYALNWPEFRYANSMELK